MKRILSIIASLALLLIGALPSLAQTGSPKGQTQLNGEVGSTFPDNSAGQITPFGLRQQQLDIIATMFAGGSPGPISVWAPSTPVIHPSSGNAQCTPGHFIWWLDQNLCTTADIFNWVSSDPSAIFSATIGGSITNGDTVNLKFEFGAGACIAGTGCTVTASVTGASTATTIAAALVAAIQANAALFTQPNGGYGSGAQIGFVTSAAGQVALDFNSNVPMKVTASITGAATETVTIATANCGTVCAAVLDNNPVLETGRNSGAAPQAGSVIYAEQHSGANSTHPTSAATTYAGVNVYVNNSTTGSLAGSWCWYTVTASGGLACREYIGSGIYTASTTDEGGDSFNGLSFWINSVYEIFQSSSTLAISTGSTNNPVVFQTGNGGVGIRSAPTGNGFEANSLSAFGTGISPSAGSGTTLFGGATPAIWSVTWTTAGGVAAYLPQNLNALSWDFKPSLSATAGFTVKANEIQPDGDNVSALGDVSHRYTALFLGAPLPVAQGGTGISGGTALLISQPITVDFSVAGDNAITIQLPSGFTHLGFCQIMIAGASADISAANFGVFTNTGAGGGAMVTAATAITVTATADNTNNNFQNTNCANVNTESYLPIVGAVQFRVGATAASGRTAKVSLRYSPLP